MIIVQLTGGLGNQLFQYVMGRSLAIQSGTTLKIDLSFFEDYEWHTYSLAAFNLKATVATKNECQLIKNKQKSFSNRLLRKVNLQKDYIINESSLLYNAEYKKAKSPSYVIGYWQSEFYFKAHEDLIRKDLEFIIAPSPANQLLINRITKTNAVSLHIRRGNYVNVAAVNNVHGTCSMDYYAAALDLIEKQVNNPVFYVFSDDISWAKANLVTHHTFVFIDINDAEHDYEDLRLMQHCQHHIIANSTFSWWGAWLNNSNDKIVIAPKQWFADAEKNKTAATIIPENWIRL